MAVFDFNKDLDNYLQKRREYESKDTKKAVLKKKKLIVSEDSNKKFKIDNTKVHELYPNMSEGYLYVIKSQPKTKAQNIIDKIKINQSKEEYELYDVDENKQSKTDFEKELKHIEKQENRWGLLSKIKGIFFRGENEVIKKEVEYEDKDDETMIMGDDTNKDFDEEYMEMKAEEKKKKGFFKKMFGFFTTEYEQITEEQQKINDLPKEKSDYLQTSEQEMGKIIEIEEDLKEVAIIATEVMKKLDKTELIKLKNSEDFVKFKTILKKYNIIKEKE